MTNTAHDETKNRIWSEKHQMQSTLFFPYLFLHLTLAKIIFVVCVSNKKCGRDICVLMRHSGARKMETWNKLGKIMTFQVLLWEQVD